MGQAGRAFIFIFIFFWLFGARGESWASDGELQKLFYLAEESGIYQKGIQSRVGFYANYFLGKRAPYLANPLGEGSDADFEKGPLFRFDAFDCTTFVETVLALSKTSSPQNFLKILNQIRYKDGVVSYRTRNHFPSLDWIPNNSENGFIRDITADIDRVHFKISQTWIEKDNWVQMKGVDYAELSQHFQKQWAQVNYIPKENIIGDPKILDRIPTVSIFHIVRPQWDLKKAIGTQLDISHVGFLIRENGVLYLVHASNGVRDGGTDYKGVKKEEFLSYVERVMMKSSTMAGFNFLEILEN